MTTSMDLNLITISRASEERGELPGLVVAEAPRRAARSRSGDMLLLYLAQEGNAPLAPEQLDQALKQVVKTYFDSAGSVTGALRTAAEGLNSYLLERNLKQASSGKQGSGLLMMVVLRGQHLYAAQVGEMQAYFITSGQAQYWSDVEQTGRSLGMAKTTTLRFYQAELQANDTLILTANRSVHWHPSSLAGLYGQGPESLRRRLLNNAPTDFTGILLQAKAGSGKIAFLRPQAVPARPESLKDPLPAVPVVPTAPPARPVSRPATAPPPGAPTPAAAAARDAGMSNPPASAGIRKPVAAGPAQPQAETEQVEVPRRVSAALPQVALPTPEVAAADADTDHQAPPLAPGILKEKPSRRDPSALGSALGKAAGPVQNSLRTFVGALRSLFVRLLPGEALNTISPATMAMIAVVVPIVVVMSASVVYFERGRAVQYTILFNQALEAAAQADAQPDLLNQRTGWRKTLDFIEQAESYQVTDESRGLKNQILKSLDEIDLIRRPNFQPAIIGGLPETIRVIRMVISDNDLYLLDGNSGAALRALATSRGYEIDRSFQCGGQSNQIIDIAAWPSENQPSAAIIGLDAAGQLYYCSPGEEVQMAALAPPPSFEWGNVAGFALDLGSLYVLDPRSNAVWVYWNGNISEQPEFFFGDEVPQMNDVVDLAVNSSELYLLHADGRMTLCYYSNLQVSPTRCTDPAYIDFRPGRENTPLTPANPFTQVINTPPPDPSLYVLESKGQAIYHFSLRNLAFQHQFISQNTLSTAPATAFAVNTVERTFFLAFENDVYYGAMP